ncbi:MAG: adenosylmethionine decarboxylase [archaeon]
MRGVHILADFEECKNKEILIDSKKLEKSVEKLILKNRLSIVGKCFYKFEKAGVTGIFLIAESHVSVHTWPEKNNSLNMDIFTCNYQGDNREKTLALFNDLKKLFEPEKITKKIIER